MNFLVPKGRPELTFRGWTCSGGCLITPLVRREPWGAGIQAWQVQSRHVLSQGLPAVSPADLVLWGGGGAGPGAAAQVPSAPRASPATLCKLSTPGAPGTGRPLPSVPVPETVWCDFPGCHKRVPCMAGSGGSQLPRQDTRVGVPDVEGAETSCQMREPPWKLTLQAQSSL